MCSIIRFLNFTLKPSYGLIIPYSLKTDVLAKYIYVGCQYSVWITSRASRPWHPYWA